MRELRKRIWIDRFQTYLSLRIAAYFLLYQVALWAFVFIEQYSYQGLETILGQVGAAYCVYFAAASVLCLGLLFVYDAVKFTHRIVGPLYRFRKTIQALTNGEELELVRLRKGDFLLEMKDDLNELLKVLDQRGVITLKTSEVKPSQKQPVGV